MANVLSIILITLLTACNGANEAKKGWEPVVEVLVDQLLQNGGYSPEQSKLLAAQAPAVASTIATGAVGAAGAVGAVSKVAAGGVSAGAAAVGGGVSAVVGGAIVNNNKRMEINVKRNNAMNDLKEKRRSVESKINDKKDKKKQKQDKLDAVTNKIEEEDRKIFAMKNVKIDENTKFMVALGHTGDGKSTVLNRLYGDDSQEADQGPFKPAYSGKSVTQALQDEKCDVVNIETVLVDTPGYSDSNGRDDAHFNNLEQYLYGSGGVDAFLLVMNGADPRFDMHKQKMLKSYAEYFGVDFWNHLIVIVTRIEGYEKNRFEKSDKAQELQSDIKREMNINLNVPIITIGFGENYDIFREQVMNAVVGISNKHDKLECDDIKSPIKELRKKKQSLKKDIKHLDGKIADLRKKLKDVKKEIADLDEKLKNPEWFPLVTNYNENV